jgi:RHS repeat-associated protein
VRPDEHHLTGTTAFLNRLIAIDRPGTAEDVTYTWDAAPGCDFGIGRLCAITDASGTHSFSYDARGNRLEHVHTVMGVSYRHAQAFDASDRVIEETLPTGLEVSYRFDAAGRPSGVWRRVAGQDFPLLTLTTRDAAGQVREAVFGNGVILARALDISGRLEGQLSDDTATLARGGPGGGGFIDGVTVLPEARSVPLPWLVLPIAMALLIRLGLMASGRRATDTPLILIALTDGVLIAALLSPRTVEALVIGYDYDGRGNIEARRFDGQAQRFSHDALDRLRSEAGAAATQSFGLDGNGNRLSDGAGSYGITPNSNRLATAPDYTPEVDAAGYTRAYRDAQTNETLMAFAWNAAGELEEVEAGGQLLATYTYEHRHLRVTKTADSATTVYHHNASGQLIAETRSSGEPLRSYLWLEGAPVAVIEHTALTGATERTLYLETDLLMTPRAATDDHGRTVWTWKGDAFGATLPEEDPDADGQATTLHLRFPGQYFEAETGLHYNWHRYYEPWTGRYLSSDPIGLRGGFNAYGYVKASPLAHSDPRGLAPDALCDRCESEWCSFICKACVKVVCDSFPLGIPCCVIERDECIGDVAPDPEKMIECQATFTQCMAKNRKGGKKPPDGPPHPDNI